VARQCARAFDTRLGAVLLTGSLARDEATAVWRESGLEVLGDAEFLLVSREGARLPARAQVMAAARQVEADLARHSIHCRVDMTAVAPRYLRQNPPHIFGFELRQSGRVIWGDPGILGLMPGYGNAELPRRDAWYLLSNRMIEAMEALAAAPVPDAATLPTASAYAMVKLCLDMASSYLVFCGRFAAGYRARQQALGRVALARLPRRDAPVELVSFARRVAWCTEWKLSGGAGELGMGAEVALAILRDAARLWYWELRHLGRDAAGQLQFGDDAAWLAAARSTPGRARSWLAAVRQRGWIRSWRRWPDWARHGAAASPRFWVYAAAGRLEARLPEILRAEWAGGASRGGPAPRSWLPLDTSEALEYEEGSPWRRIAREIADNYHALVEKTRS